MATRYNQLSLSGDAAAIATCRVPDPSAGCLNKRLVQPSQSVVICHVAAADADADADVLLRAFSSISLFSALPADRGLDEEAVDQWTSLHAVGETDCLFPGFPSYRRLSMHAYTQTKNDDPHSFPRRARKSYHQIMGLLLFLIHMDIYIYIYLSWLNLSWWLWWFVGRRINNRKSRAVGNYAHTRGNPGSEATTNKYGAATDLSSVSLRPEVVVV